MAAYEGFLTSVYAGTDLLRPSFFELIAQEQLNEAIRPAIRFLLGRWSDVSYGLLLLLLEVYHLSAWGSKSWLRGVDRDAAIAIDYIATNNNLFGSKHILLLISWTFKNKHFLHVWNFVRSVRLELFNIKVHDPDKK